MNSHAECGGGGGEVQWYAFLWIGKCRMGYLHGLGHWGPGTGPEMDFGGTYPSDFTD